MTQHAQQAYAPVTLLLMPKVASFSRQATPAALHVNTAATRASRMPAMAKPNEKGGPTGAFTALAVDWCRERSDMTRASANPADSPPDT